MYLFWNFILKFRKNFSNRFSLLVFIIKTLFEIHSPLFSRTKPFSPFRPRRAFTIFTFNDGVSDDKL